MVLVSEHLPSIFSAKLRELGHTVIALPSDPRLPLPVAAHPDMLVFLTQDTLITDRFYYEHIAQDPIDQICSLGKLALRLSDEPPGQDYPHDIRFNAALVGQYLFCAPAYTSPAILSFARSQNITIVPVRQGYAKCSICPVGDHAIISADPSILRAASKQKDLDVLSIHQSPILLPGYPLGFFGGCCGGDQSHVYICGDLSTHPDEEAIRSFIASHGCKLISLGSDPLFDGGSLFFVPAQSAE